MLSPNHRDSQGPANDLMPKANTDNTDSVLGEDCADKVCKLEYPGRVIISIKS